MNEISITRFFLRVVLVSCHLFDCAMDTSDVSSTRNKQGPHHSHCCTPLPLPHRPPSSPLKRIKVIEVIYLFI